MGREYKRMSFKQTAFDDDKGILSGYASVYGNIDDGQDIVEPGAFTRFLEEEGIERVKILALHRDYDLPVGKPIAVKDTDDGLFIEARISDTQMGRDVKTLIRDGVLDELSIGYDAVKWDIDANGIRHLRELRLWEVSVVTWAMNAEATITGYKAATPPATATPKPTDKPRVKPTRSTAKSRDRPGGQGGDTIYEIVL